MSSRFSSPAWNFNQCDLSDCCNPTSTSAVLQCAAWDGAGETKTQLCCDLYSCSQPGAADPVRKKENGTASLQQHLCSVACNPPHACYQANHQSSAVNGSKDSPWVLMLHCFHRLSSSQVYERKPRAVQK